MKRAKKLDARQRELVSMLAGHRAFIDASGPDGPRFEEATLMAVGWALELLGHDRNVRACIRQLLGHDASVDDEEIQPLKPEAVR